MRNKEFYITAKERTIFLIASKALNLSENVLLLPECEPSIPA